MHTLADIMSAYSLSWVITTILFITLLFFAIRYLLKKARRQERIKAAFEKELFMLQSKALNAQMNPHFIFNCLNSIKSLVQMNENNQAVDYLNLFAKLTRSLMQYSEKSSISLHDELEICQWYIQLETLRFGSKVNVDFMVGDQIDTKLVTVPVLLIQPFIENAISHGLVPMQKEGGLLQVNLFFKANTLVCTIEDNGIGRAAAIRRTALTRKHQSKGMSLSQERINLYNKQHENKVSINISDKFDEAGEPCGTLVSITFTNNHND